MPYSNKDLGCWLHCLIDSYFSHRNYSSRWLAGGNSLLYRVALLFSNEFYRHGDTKNILELRLLNARRHAYHVLDYFCMHKLVGFIVPSISIVTISSFTTYKADWITRWENEKMKISGILHWLTFGYLGAIILFLVKPMAAEAPQPMYQMIYDLTPSDYYDPKFPPKEAIENRETYNLAPWLKSFAVPMPDGASAVYDPRTKRATFVNTYDNLQLVVTLFSPAYVPPKLKMIDVRTGRSTKSRSCGNSGISPVEQPRMPKAGCG